jgi:hypothetical protein
VSTATASIVQGGKESVRLLGSCRDLDRPTGETFNEQSAPEILPPEQCTLFIETRKEINNRFNLLLPPDYQSNRGKPENQSELIAWAEFKDDGEPGNSKNMNPSSNLNNASYTDSIPQRLLRCFNGNCRGYQPLFITTLLSVLFLYACSKPDDVKQIENQIEQMKLAVEQEDPDDFLEHIDQGFVGNYQFDRKLIKKYLIANMLRHSNIKVNLTHHSVSINPIDSNLANVEISVMLTGGKGFIPEQGRLMKIRSEWVKQEGQWRVKLARWGSHH